MLDKKVFRKKIIKSSFLLVLVMFFGFSTITLSKYVTGVYASDTGRVAKFSIFNDIESIPIHLGKLDNMNHSFIYDFIITNEDKSHKITETLYQYKIKVYTMENIPINIELYKNNDSQNLLNESFETEYMVMKIGELQEDRFQLKIDLENSSYLDSDLIDYLDIEIKLEQID